MNSDPITILMGTYNGARFLEAQLSSIARQNHANWHLCCSDDGSTDETSAVINRFATQMSGQVTLLDGPRSGFCANYMNMIRTLPSTSGYVSFADQDDIWLPDKLSRGRVALEGAQGTPTLYCTRRWNWFPDQAQRNVTAPPRHPCTFQNALIENVASGNTIMLNPAAALLAKKAAEFIPPVFAHDWWLYLLITGVGGQVIFDVGPPTILYRQHGLNLIGAGQGPRSQVQRKMAVMRGAFAARIQGNLDALNAITHLLTPKNRRILAHFEHARRARLVPRLRSFARSGAYRQSRTGTLGFWGAASLGHI